MKYAFMTFSMPREGLQQVLEAARQFGYDGIEPRVESGHAHGVELGASPAARRQMRGAAEKAGVAMACVATSCLFADPQTAQRNVELGHRYIDLAADVGSSRIRVFGGAIGGGLSREAAIELVARSLSSLADHASERGVLVCMETHDDWCDPAHVAEVMGKVARPSIGVNWDLMHPVKRAGYTMDRAYEILKKWVHHVHFHDGTLEGKLRPIPEGIVDHRSAVRLLRDAGYQGYLSGEWINWEIGYPEHLPRELSTMKSYEGGRGIRRPR